VTFHSPGDVLDVAGGEQVEQGTAEDGEQERTFGLGEIEFVHLPGEIRAEATMRLLLDQGEPPRDVDAAGSRPRRDTPGAQV